MSWWTRRCVARRPFHVFSSYYLVPLVTVLGFAHVDVFVPLVTVLVVVGCVTTIASRLQGHNSSFKVLMSIVGHTLPLAAYVGRGLPRRESLYPSLALLAIVFAIYKTADEWPYSVSPLEFSLLSLIGFVLYEAIS